MCCLSLLGYEKKNLRKLRSRKCYCGGSEKRPKNTAVTLRKEAQQNDHVDLKSSFSVMKTVRTRSLYACLTGWGRKGKWVTQWTVSDFGKDKL